MKEEQREAEIKAVKARARAAAAEAKQKLIELGQLPKKKVAPKAAPVSLPKPPAVQPVVTIDTQPTVHVMSAIGEELRQMQTDVSQKLIEKKDLLGDLIEVVQSQNEILHSIMEQQSQVQSQPQIQPFPPQIQTPIQTQVQPQPHTLQSQIAELSTLAKLQPMAELLANSRIQTQILLAQQCKCNSQPTFLPMPAANTYQQQAPASYSTSPSHPLIDPHTIAQRVAEQLQPQLSAQISSQIQAMQLQLATQMQAMQPLPQQPIIVQQPAHAAPIITPPPSPIPAPVVVEAQPAAAPPPTGEDPLDIMFADMAAELSALSKKLD